LEVDPAQSARLLRGMVDVGRDIQWLQAQVSRIRSQVAGQRGPVQPALRSLEDAEALLAHLGLPRGPIDLSSGQYVRGKPPS